MECDDNLRDSKNTESKKKTKYSNILSEHEMFKSIHEHYKDSVSLRDLIVEVKKLDRFHQTNVNKKKK
mgnify:FL=1